MTAFNSLESRYQRDPSFHALVDQLEFMIHKLQFTPSELREAVMYAAFRFEMARPQAVQVRLDGDAMEIHRIRERSLGKSDCSKCNGIGLVGPELTCSRCEGSGKEPT